MKMHTRKVIIGIICLLVFLAVSGIVGVLVLNRERPLLVSRMLGQVMPYEETVNDLGVVQSAPSAGGGFAAKGMMIAPMPPVPSPGGATPEERAAVGPKIITTGSVSIRVDNADDKLAKLKDIAQQEGGFVADAYLNDNNGVKSGSITIRIPEAKYDETVAAVKKLALVVFSESSNANDVTAQYIDLNARLKAAQAEEAQYLEILKQARTVQDTLQVTAQLADVRSRIEQLQGQLRYLSDQTDYATLTVSLTEEAHVEVPTRTWKPWETFKQSLRGLVTALQVLVDVLITGAVFVIGFLLPILVVLALIAWGIRALWRRFRK